MRTVMMTTVTVVEGNGTAMEGSWRTPGRRKSVTPHQMGWRFRSLLSSVSCYALAVLLLHSSWLSSDSTQRNMPTAPLTCILLAVGASTADKQPSSVKVSSLDDLISEGGGAEKGGIEQEKEESPSVSSSRSDPTSASTATSDDGVILVTDEEEKAAGGLSPEEEEKLMGKLESHQYQAEVNRLMDIIINSLYTQREVFLRELISNAADALEKARFLSLADNSVLASSPNLDIRVDFDKDAKTLSITDTGIGMSKQDLINNLGTVAKSGTSNFLEALASGGDVNLIGQFGVGFYSAFLVADKVTVYSKSNDDQQQIWVSSADGSFSIAADPRGPTLGRGTRITLHLKEDATEFLNENKLRDLVARYSQFISFPIYLKSQRIVTEEVPVEEKEEEQEKEEKESADKEKKESEDDEDVAVKDEDAAKEEGEKKKPKTKKLEKTVKEWKQLNTQKAIWLRPKEEVTEKEYHEFYRSVTKDWTDPLTYIHFTGEGEIEFKAILYIPGRAPMDMFDNYFNKQTSIKLYVRRVLVADQFEDLLPKYLHFVKGVVDSDDLPLNVSREQLQQHKIMHVISKKLARKVLELIRKLSKDSDKEREDLKSKIGAETDEEAKKKLETQMKDPTKFESLWKEFSRNMKLGCYEDDGNRSKVAKILRFYTSKHTERPIGLEDYIANMKEGQKAIYYAAGDSVAQLRKIPQIQMFEKKGVEVLLLVEAMDEPCIQKLSDFEGKRFESIQKADVSLDQTEEEKKREKKLKKLYEPLLTWWKNQIGHGVQKVDISKRLVNDPVAVVSSQWGYSGHMEKIMKTQTFADSTQVKMMAGQKILEVNADHPLVYEMLKRVKADPKDPKLQSTAQMLVNTAMMASGFELEDPQGLSSVIYNLVAGDVGISIDPAAAPVVDLSEIDDDADVKEEEIDSDGVEEEEEEVAADSETAEAEGRAPEKDDETEKEESETEKEESEKEKDEL